MCSMCDHRLDSLLLAASSPCPDLTVFLILLSKGAQGSRLSLATFCGAGFDLVGSSLWRDAGLFELAAWTIGLVVRFGECDSGSATFVTGVGSAFAPGVVKVGAGIAFFNS